MKIEKGIVVWAKDKKILGVIIDELPVASKKGIECWRVVPWDDPESFDVERSNELIPLFRIDPKDLKLSRKKIFEKYLTNFFEAIFLLLGKLSSAFEIWQESHIEHYHTP